AKRRRELSLRSFMEYVLLLQTDRSGKELVELINRLTTNHSFVYREREHFDFLTSTILPPLVASAKAKGPYQLRIWSAGCAAGEEAHSIAIALREALASDFSRMDPAILATDISIDVLEEGKRGIYPIARFRELPPAFLSRYFKKIDAENYEALPSIHELILFKRLNLMAAPYPMKTSFDLVFCRNVMIYFDGEVRKRLINALYEVVKPGGYLFVGHSETLQRGDSNFTYVKPAIYRRDGD
ncbi:MAG: protein-glutamate O-methyltransferase CheR, partial [Spirochaetota bacterium]